MAVPAGPIFFGPAPYECDDFRAHCFANIPAHTICDSTRTYLCVGLAGATALRPGTPTPRSYSNRAHPGPNNIRVCHRCIQHTGDFLGQQLLPIRYQLLIQDIQVRQHNPEAFKGQLCHGCIKDEMKLYWARQATAQPAAPVSVTAVDTWPTTAAAPQNLCICEENAIDPYAFHCHACRREAFQLFAADEKDSTAEFLGKRQKAVIKGTRRCVLNGGTQGYIVDGGVQARRWNDNRFRQCPCGETPKRSDALEYIDYCMSCMGVEVDPANLPPKYQQINFPTPRRSARNHGTPIYAPTKGPKRAARNPRFRVNIERGWVPNDPYVGGTW